MLSGGMNVYAKNQSESAWLSNEDDSVKIRVGTNLEDFITLCRKAGSEVYIPLSWTGYEI